MAGGPIHRSHRQTHLLSLEKTEGMRMQRRVEEIADFLGVGSVHGGLPGL